MSKRRIGEKFCPITAKRARDWYQKKYISTAGYLLIIKEILRPPGVNLKIDNVSKFCAEWGISRAAFYRALSTLNVNNDGTWETSGAITLSTTSESEQNCLSTGQLSHERDAKSHERDAKSHERDTESHERDTQPPEPPPNNASKSSQTYTDFIQTLSDSEREKFLNFVREKTKNFNPAIACLSDYLATNERWREFYKQFRAVAYRTTESHTKPKRKGRLAAKIDRMREEALRAQEQEEINKEAANSAVFSPDKQ